MSVAVSGQRKAVRSMAWRPARAPLIPRGKNRELAAKLAHFEDLRQLGRAITHSAAQPSYRTALHGSSVRRIC